MKPLLRLLLAAALTVQVAAASAQALRVNITMDPPHLNPFLYQENVSFRVLHDLYEGFTTATPDGANEPALALSWQPLEGRHGFRFRLRPGVTFHTGRAFTAGEVKANLELFLRDARSKSSSASPFVETIVGAEAVRSGSARELAGVKLVDDHTVEIELARANPIFPIMPFQFADSAFVEANGPDWTAKASAGTGPFKYVSWNRGVAVEVAAHDAYWAGKPKIPGIRFLVVPNPETVFAQYDAGELDVADLQESMFNRAMREDRYKAELVQGQRAALWWMGMHQGLYAPFKDKRVREAISLAIDRAGMVRGLFQGAAASIPGFVTPGLGGFRSELPALRFDPARAKQLLAEAGYPDGRGLPPVTITGWPEIRDVLTYYAAQLNRVLGMPVSVNVIERTTWIRSVNAGEVAFFPSRWSAGFLDPSVFLDDVFHSKSPYNRARWSNAEYDRLIEEARSTTDAPARLALLQRAERVLMEDWGSFSLPVAVTAGLRKPRIRDVTTHPVGFLNLRNASVN